MLRILKWRESCWKIKVGAQMSRHMCYKKGSCSSILYKIYIRSYWILCLLHIMSHCISCPIAYHVPLHIMSHCISCPIAYHVPLHIMSHCISCPIAYHVPLHIMSHCISCPIAYHVPLHIMSHCISCPIAYHVSPAVLSLNDFILYLTLWRVISCSIVAIAYLAYCIMSIAYHTHCIPCLLHTMPIAYQQKYQFYSRIFS